LTRSQACEAVVAAIKKSDAGITLKFTHEFTDTGKLSVSARQSMSICYEYEIIQGKDGNKILPDGTVSREQAVSMIDKAYNCFFADN
jgi:S-layer homology domain.